MVVSNSISSLPQWAELEPSDRIDEYDEWQPTGGDSERWFQAWPEDWGKTVAQAQEEAAQMGESDAYRWRGLR